MGTIISGKRLSLTAVGKYMGAIQLSRATGISMDRLDEIRASDEIEVTDEELEALVRVLGRPPESFAPVKREREQGVGQYDPTVRWYQDLFFVGDEQFYRILADIYEDWEEFVRNVKDRELRVRIARACDLEV